MKTVQDVQAALDQLSTFRLDNESAHELEDKLWFSVLMSIANGSAEDPQEMARLATTSRELDFDRWFA